MGVFNVSFLRPGAVKSGGGSGYNILVDEITRKKNELMGDDGVLSPGDYDILIALSRKAYATPGLTKDQRSNIDTQFISTLSKDKSVAGVNKNQDLTRINGDFESNRRSDTMAIGNDLGLFLRASVDNLYQKANDIAQTIQNLQNAGQDTATYDAAWEDTNQQIQDMSDAGVAMETYQPGANQPIPGFAAYVTTNARGEITKVDVSRDSARTGYAETNAVYGGFQVFGKTSPKAGKKTFKLGNTEYVGNNLNISDPNSPGSFMSAPLVPTKGKYLDQSNYSILQYQDVNPAEVRTQKTVRPGDWARGQNGFLYKGLDDGSYRKYVGVLPDQLGISETSILDVPPEYETGFNASETIDGAAQNVPQMSTQDPGSYDASRAAASAAPVMSKVPAAPAPGPTARARTPSPTQRTPSGALGYAKRAVDSAKKFFG